MEGRALGLFPECGVACVRRLAACLLAVAAACFLLTGLRGVVPADAAHAIEAHLPQGYDRSLIAARAERRRTKALLLAHLPLAPLREALRRETARVAKLRLWDETLRRTLAGLLAASYLHSLTITLCTLKNTVRVLVFLLRRREEEAGLRRQGLVPGAISTLRAWWVNGTKAVMMERVVRLMSRRLAQASSPFANGELEEEDETAGTGTWPLPPQPRTAGEERVEDATGLEPDGFSVRRVLAVAAPRIIEFARVVVAKAFARYPSHLFDVANVVQRGELRGLFGDLAAGMEREVGVSTWAGLGPLSLPTVAAEHGVFDDPSRTPTPDGEADDVVEFPAGSTAVLGRNGKLASLRKGPENNGGGLESASDASLRPHQGGDAVGFPGSSASLDTEETPMDTFQLERRIKTQSAGFFQELLCSMSVQELVLDHAAETLNQTFREILENLPNVKSYDEATDSVKMLMLIAALEAPRQRLYDAEFDIKSYLKLFCEETVRSTCSQ